MIRGGYQIVDLHNTAFTVGGDAVIVAGVYEAINNENRKVTILSGINIGGVGYPDTMVRFNKATNDYIGVVNTVWTDDTSAVATLITVTSENAITIENATITGA